MQTLTNDHLNDSSGGMAIAREQETGMLTIAVGIATRGYWLPMSEPARRLTICLPGSID